MRERILLALFVLTFPLVAYVSSLPPQRFHNAITEWGDHRSQAYQEFCEYRKKFGANEAVIFSWPGCELNDERLEKVAVEIETQLAGLVHNVSSGQRAYRALREAKLSEEVALKRLRNVFIGKENFDTAIGFQLTEKARTVRSDVISRLETILKSAGVDPESVTYAGLGYNLYALDKEGLESPFRMVPQIMLLAFVLTILFVRDIRLAIFINALGSYTGCLAFCFVWLADVDMNAIIWPLPTLTMLLTVSASLHFLSYFRKTVQLQAIGADSNPQTNLDNRRLIARQTARSAVKPLVCCTLTTAIGLLSLLLSSSEPVRQFGMFGAISIIAANLLLLLWFPPFLVLAGRFDSIKNPNDSQRGRPPKNDRWKRWEAFTRGYRWPIISICLVVLLLSGIGFPKIKTGSNLDNFFPAEHSVLAAARSMESRIGPLNSVELLLTFDDVNPENDRLRIRYLKALANRIQSQTEFTSCFSAATFSPSLQQSHRPFQRAVEDARLEKFKLESVNAKLIHLDAKKSQTTWRISCRYSIFEKLDLALQQKQLEQIANTLFTREGKSILDGETLTITTTGEFVLFDQVDRQFFRELMLTYAAAFSVIALVVLLVLKDLRTALVALLPNLFPALVVLGTAGFLGYSLDVASLMTASVALGIAVDDTLHFLIWHKGISKSNSKLATQQHPQDDHPVVSALRYSGTAMIQSSAILGLSIVLYAFCGFLPTVRFGILLSAMMLAALIGDLLLLPALLALQKRTANVGKPR